METAKCCVCQKLKALLKCGICNNPVCKKCVQFVEPETFPFFKKIPAKLAHSTYCGPCYFNEIDPELKLYEQIVEEAKNVAIFYKDQGKETRRMARSTEIFSVKKCKDRNEAIMRLAFFAAQSGFNTLVDVDLQSEKIREGSYQHLIWHADAVPVLLSSEKLKRK